MIGTPRAGMHGAGAIRSRSRDHAAQPLGVPVRLYVHLTWTTLQRQPLINHGVADFLRRFLPREAKRHGARLLASGVVADHVHVVLQLPPVTNIPRLIQGLKGASARLANRDGLMPRAPLRWAAGYDLRWSGGSVVTALRPTGGSRPRPRARRTSGRLRSRRIWRRRAGPLRKSAPPSSRRWCRP